MGTVNRRAELLRSLKFTLFSASAGLIQIGAFALCNDVIHLPAWLGYLIALVLSVLWNFTLYRRYTFRSAAPKGRLILPQQQTIRSLLDAGCIPVVARETELARTLSLLREPPALVVTDSQAFGMVSRIVPDSVRLTSFSILFARYKGDLRTAVLGAAALRQLKDGDTVLISEGCTHHRQCGDIGTEKLPRWVRQYTGRDIRFVFTSGGEFPENLSPYALIIHCGACMLGEREMQSRLRRAAEQCIPVTNYGIAIAQIHGILDRALRPFSALHAEWKKQQQ